MKRRQWVLGQALGLMMLMGLGAAGCGGDDEGGGTGGAGGTSSGSGGSTSSGSGGGGGSAVDPHCAALVAGLNSGFMVDGAERSFILNLPANADTGGPFPVVFNWHGLGDTAQNMNTLIAGLVDTPDFPLIAVTPEDADHLILGQSMDWDVFEVDAATNTEARLFDEILVCLDQRWGVNPDHIHSVGFSLGSILTDMLGVIRGEQLASIATYSGAYFSNSANVGTLGMLSDFVSWPAPSHGNSYSQVVIHGGSSDAIDFGVAIIQFDAFAANDQTYLNGMGHDVVLCDHGGGHTAPAAGMMPAQMIQFFRDHPKGTTDSPYASGLPGEFSSSCAFHDGG